MDVNGSYHVEFLALHNLVHDIPLPAGGTYQVNTGQTSCNEADAGYYVDQTGQVSQTACPAGTQQLNTGQATCEEEVGGGNLLLMFGFVVLIIGAIVLLNSRKSQPPSAEAGDGQEIEEEVPELAMKGEDE